MTVGGNQEFMGIRKEQRHGGTAPLQRALKLGRGIDFQEQKSVEVSFHGDQEAKFQYFEK